MSGSKHVYNTENTNETELSNVLGGQGQAYEHVTSYTTRPDGQTLKVTLAPLTSVSLPCLHLRDL